MRRIETCIIGASISPNTFSQRNNDLPKSQHVITGLVCALISFAAESSMISYDFAGHLTSVIDNQNWIPGMFHAGDRFAGSVTYTTDVTPESLFDADPTVNIYSAVMAATMTVNGYTWNSTSKYQTVFPGYLQVWDNRNVGGPTDLLGFNSPIDYTPPVQVPASGELIGSFTLLLADYTHSLFQSDALPVAPLTLSQFSYRSMNALELDLGSNRAFHLGGTLDSLTWKDIPYVPPVTPVTPGPSVPEPASLCLLAIGAAGIVVRRKARA